MEPITAASGSQSFSVSAAMGQAQGTKQDFLNLLVTQLRHQDPFEPVSNEQFLTQLATFSQLEEQQITSQAIKDLITLQNASLVLGGLSQGASLVGKEVTWFDPESEEFSTGLVSRVSFDPTGVLLTIGEQIVPVGNVVGISVAGASGTGGTSEPPQPQTEPLPASQEPSQQDQ